MGVSGPSDGHVAASFGARLRGFREIAGLTQQQLADRMACSRKQVGRWESGATGPKRSRLQQLEGPLGLAPGTLVEVLDSLDSRARGQRMGRVSRLFEEGFGAHTDLAAAALGDWDRDPLDLAERRLTTWSEVVESLIQLSVAASHRSPHAGESVTLISGEWTADYIARSNAKRRWKLSIQALLASGWRIQHLWCGNAVPAFEEWIVDFLGFEGRYELSKVGRGGVTPSFVLLDAPGVGGLIAFVRRDSPEVSAWISTCGPILDLVHDAAIYALGAGQLQPNRQFVEYERPSEEVAQGLSRPSLELEVQMAMGEKLPGEHLMLKDGMPAPTQPERIAVELRERHLHGVAGTQQAAAVQSFFEARLQRIRQFRECLDREVNRTICSLEAIDEFMATGSWPADTSEPIEAVEDLALRRAWLGNVVGLLKSHPRTFRVALVDRQTRPLLRRAFWKTVGDRCLFFAVGGKRTAFGHSFESGVVATFRGIFEDLWEALPLSAHDPRVVIARLERAMKRQPRPPRPKAG